MPPGVTTERVAGQQAGIDDHHHRADANAEPAVAEKRRDTLPPEADEQKQRPIKRIAMEVLNDKERRLSTIGPPDAAYGASGRAEEERLVVSAAIVVAREAEGDGDPREEERRSLRQERRPPGRKRSEPGVADGDGPRIAGGRREERGSDSRAEVRVGPDVRRPEGSNGQVAEQD